MYQAGKITAKCLLIGLALAARLGANGRLDPSHATIAADARSGPRTVRRALARLSELGMVHWVRRLVRTSDWRTEQASNSYALCMAEGRPACDGQSGRQTRTKVLSSASAAAARTVKDAVKGVVRALASPPGDAGTLREIRERRQQALGVG